MLDILITRVGMKRICLKKVLTAVSRTLFESNEYLIADMKIEIQSESDPRYCYLLFNYPLRFFRGACGSNKGLRMTIYKIRVKSLGEVRIYIKGELKEYWKTFSEFWEKYKN
jgi:hypothetical protein